MGIHYIPGALYISFPMSSFLSYSQGNWAQGVKWLAQGLQLQMETLEFVYKQLEYLTNQPSNLV